jgi:hypothetical protein
MTQLCSPRWTLISPTKAPAPPPQTTASDPIATAPAAAKELAAPSKPEVNSKDLTPAEALRRQKAADATALEAKTAASARAGSEPAKRTSAVSGMSGMSERGFYELVWDTQAAREFAERIYIRRDGLLEKRTTAEGGEVRDLVGVVVLLCRRKYCVEVAEDSCLAALTFDPQDPSDLLRKIARLETRRGSFTCKSNLALSAAAAPAACATAVSATAAATSTECPPFATPVSAEPAATATTNLPADTSNANAGLQPAVVTDSNQPSSDQSSFNQSCSDPAGSKQSSSSQSSQSGSKPSGSKKGNSGGKEKVNDRDALEVSHKTADRIRVSGEGGIAEIEVPQKAMAVYVTVHPRSMLAAWKLVNAEVDEQLVQRATQGFNGDVDNNSRLKANWSPRKLATILTKAAMSVKPNCRRDNLLLDLDVDTKDPEWLRQLAQILRVAEPVRASPERSTSVMAADKQYPAICACIETRGGYHVLVRRSGLSREQLTALHKLCRKTAFQAPNSLGQTCTRHLISITDSNELVPLPGTIQGSHRTRLVPFTSILTNSPN